jgi:hypothetical protein
MTPRDESVHVFVRDLNKAIERHAEWERRDVPQTATDEWNQWQDVRADLQNTVEDLSSRVWEFFPLL